MEHEGRHHWLMLSILLLGDPGWCQFVQQPVDVVSRPGADVRVPCVVEPEYNTAPRIWLIYTVFLHTNSTKPVWITIATETGVFHEYRDHYQLAQQVINSGDASQVDFSLIVLGVEPDEPAVRCAVEVNNRKVPSNTAVILVVDYTPRLLALALRGVNLTNAPTIMKELQELTYQPTALDVDDVTIVSDILSSVVQTHTDDPQVTELAVGMMNNLMKGEQQVLSEAQKYNASSSRLVQSLEQLAIQMRLIGEHFTLDTGDVKLQVLESGCNSFPGFAVIQVPYSSQSQITNHMEGNANVTLASIIWNEDGKKLTDTACSNADERIIFSFYSSGSLFTPVGPADQKYSMATVASAVVSATISGQAGIMSKPVTLNFKIEKDEILSAVQPVCVFWDFTLAGGRGGWSDYGCENVPHAYNLSAIEKTVITCSCNHLTNFAVIFDHEQGHGISAAHQLALSIITLLGLSLSMAGLLATILTFAVFRHFRESARNVLVFQLSLALLGTDIFFIVTSQQLSSVISCRAVAALLHYFLLASFCWLLLEGIFYYLKLGRDFPIYVPHFNRISALISWLTPLVIVTVTLSAGPDNYRHVGPEKYCWLSLVLLYWGFLLPVVLVMLVNLLLYLLIIRHVTCGRLQQAACTSSKEAEARERNKKLRASIFIFLLLGLTWSLGLFAVREARVFFQYLFCLINSLHGVLVFWLHVLRDTNSRQAWRDLLFASHTCSNGRDKEPETVTTPAAAKTLMWRNGRPVVVDFGASS